MPFTAKYPGDCADCNAGIVAGERVEYDMERNLHHVVCPTAPTTPPAPPCPTCMVEMEPDPTDGWFYCPECDDDE